MARFPRTHLPAAAYHVMGRGNGGEAIFSEPEDYREFTEVLARLKESSPFELFAYCLMPNHIHLFLRVWEVALSAIMQRLLTAWARRFNWARERRGHVFQGRFKSIPCLGDDYARRLVRYIHLNPVTAGLAAAPEDWPWSSHRDFMGLRSGGVADTGWPLSLFGGSRESARRAYEDFLREGSADLFSDETMDDSRAVPDLFPPRDIPRRPSIESLLVEAAQAAGFSPELLQGSCRARDLCAARRLFALRSSRTGHSLAAIAAALGVSTTAVRKMLLARGAPELSPKVQKVHV